MATHNLGKLKIKTSEDGIAFRFGEGKIHRLSLGRKGRNADPDYNEDEYMNDEAYAGEEEYTSDDGYVPGGYSGRFAQGPNADDGYDDDFGDDYDDRYNDGYADD